jgi:hypothetical protein
VTGTETHVICTLFDHRYLPRGLCMIQSAQSHGFGGDIWVLCLSDECEHRMRALAMPGIRTISLGQLEMQIPRLKEAKNDRDIVEYYFTCMAALHTWLFETQPEIGGTMYVDADMQFFDNPESVFDAIGDAPVAVTPHNFLPQNRNKEIYGEFNAGWSAFRRTPEGLSCLKWWLDRSLEWCHDWVDGERYANQKYMNQFPAIAPRTRILRQKGFNCAPWNIGNYKLSERKGRLWVDEEPLVFYHFHSLKRRLIFFEFPDRKYGAQISWLARNRLYRPYVRELLRMERQNCSPPSANGQARADLRSPVAAGGVCHYLGKMMRSPWKVMNGLPELLRNLPVIVIGSRVL